MDIKGYLYESNIAFDNQVIAHVKEKCKMNIVSWEPTKKEYPSYMLLGPDKGILAYINFYTFIAQDLTIFRHDVGSLLARLRLAVSDLDRPVFNIYQVTEASETNIYFETYEQILDILFNNPDRIKIDDKGREYFDSQKNEMGSVDELLTIFTDLKRNNVKFS